MTSSTTSTRRPAPTEPGRASSGGPSARSAALRPVCAGPGPRMSNERTGRWSRRPTARASSSAWSNPRSRRRPVLVGSQHTTSGSGAAPTRPAMPSASHATEARASRYLSRATTSRAAPSYVSSARASSTPSGNGTRPAGRISAMHAEHGDAPRRRQIGQAGGNSTPANLRTTCDSHDRYASARMRGRRPAIGQGRRGDRGRAGPSGPRCGATSGGGPRRAGSTARPPGRGTGAPTRRPPP